ncbi:c-type cytochrome [Cyanobacterium stanieri LEGE 03274]|uniref:Cytochrome c6 n=1 Tax=Cyanobacterium stanieri LEGE 03274 TaxID=1828756 RepID=A0ABR9V2Q6_9CHRO|nr:c-type cytochrome [Cyanobacterium stanieri]MBE9222183.1 c-type cytochrome [Cyanobacterium stanieri LEGE 03274]
MKKIFTLILLLITFISFSLPSPALAGDISKGATIFSANCASCHMGGRNVVNPAKTLQKSDLEKYDMYSLEKIINQVNKGKAAMPSFLGRLDNQQIEDVASYVLSQAEKGWN